MSSPFTTPTANTDASATTDADLIAACRKGDETAWVALVQRYQRLVYAIPRRSGMDDDHAAEVFQRTFVKLVEKLDRIAHPERLAAWLITTAKRETWRYSKRERAAVGLPGTGDDDDEIELPDDAPPLGEDLIALEQQHTLRAGLTALDERCRTLLTLLYYRVEPPAYSDIAKQLGTSEGSIGPTRARCLEKLRKWLSKAGISAV